jgi:hypothetical protein
MKSRSETSLTFWDFEEKEPAITFLFDQTIKRLGREQSRVNLDTNQEEREKLLPKLTSTYHNT